MTKGFVVSEAVKNNGLALFWEPEGLKNEVGVVFEIVRQNHRASESSDS